MFKEWFDAWVDLAYSNKNHYIKNELNSFKRYNFTICELSKLSDKELSDLGIKRNEIPYLALKYCKS